MVSPQGTARAGAWLFAFGAGIRIETPGEAAALCGLIPLYSDDPGEMMKIATDLQLLPHSSRLSRYAGQCQNYSPHA